MSDLLKQMSVFKVTGINKQWGWALKTHVLGSGPYS